MTTPRFLQDPDVITLRAGQSHTEQRAYRLVMETKIAELEAVLSERAALENAEQWRRELSLAVAKGED